MEWYWILLIVIGLIIVWFTLSALLYKPFFKRFYDITLSGIAIIMLSPILIILTITGAIVMKGNPFFTQERPGKNEKIFKLIKFRSMTCEKDENGNLLPDEKRLVKYGRILRSTSLDELPELFNIFIGNMSIVGPRPLAVEYLGFYTPKENFRHSVLPGLTGLAQVNGRTSISWKNKFEWDLRYIDTLSLYVDIKIILKTIYKVFARNEVISSEEQKDFFDVRIEEWNNNIITPPHNYEELLKKIGKGKYE